jgi:glycosyltransferase involved in cell wall biosynthesis
VPSPERDPAADPPRRIAFVVTRSDGMAGVQLYVLGLTRALQEAGHAVRVFVGGQGVFVDRLREAGVPVTPIPAMIRSLDPRAELRASVHLFRALREFGPELITTHSSKAGILGRVLGRALGVPVLVTAHGWLLTPGKLSARQRLVWLVEAGAAPLAARTLAVSEYDRGIALEHRVVPAAKIAVVPNALPDLDPPQLADPSRSPPTIVMVARFEIPKLPTMLIAALARLLQLDWRCELIGDGPLRPEVEAAIAQVPGLGDRVALLGTRDDVPERLAAAQIAVLVSEREGFPLAVLEAMRAGLPVVASAVGGIPEAITPACGRLVAPGVEALVDALAPLLQDPQLRARLGAASRARFLAEFRYEVHVRRTWAVYAELLSARS